jgi:hypothetical protein
MGRATDCDRQEPMRFWADMPDFTELKARIEALCTRATSGEPDARLLVEIEDLLAEGYVSALQGDHLTRRLQSRLETLMEAAESVEQLRTVARERRMISDATEDLRSRLDVMRRHWIALGSERLGLA